MESHLNPYRPGAGTKPIVLAGRDSELAQIRGQLEAVKSGAPQRSFMLYGLRGVGKTVLLSKAKEMAGEIGYEVEHLEMSESIDFGREVAKTLRKILLRLSRTESMKEKVLSALRILKAFSVSIPDGPEFKLDIDAAVGTADSGDLESDLVDLFLGVGKASKATGKPICLLIDEVQYLNEEALRGLIGASHRLAQESLPILFVCAGLPQVAALAGDAKSYAERLFAFVPIGSLAKPEARRALEEPASQLGVRFDVAASERLLDEAEGYPYFIQELGKHSWNIASNGPVRLIDANMAIDATYKALDESFFKVRLDRTSASEKAFMRALAATGRGPYRMSEAAASMSRKVASLSPVRAALIKKGLLYSPSLGMVDFTVPQFDSFIRRSPN